MITKITGKGSIVDKVNDAVTLYTAGTIDSATYIERLGSALAQLEDYSDQLEGNITKERIMDPEATTLRDQYVEMHIIIDNLILNP